MTLNKLFTNQLKVFGFVSIILTFLSVPSLLHISQPFQIILLFISVITISYLLYSHSKSLSFFIPTIVFTISVTIALFFISTPAFQIVDYSKPIILKNDSVKYAPNDNGIFLTGFETHGLLNHEIATISATTTDEVLISNYELKSSGSIIPIGIARNDYSNQEIEISFSKNQKSNLELYPIYSINLGMLDKLVDFISLKTELLILSHIEITILLVILSLCFTYLYYSQSKYFSEIVFASVLISYVCIAMHIIPQHLQSLLYFALYALAIQTVVLLLSKKRSLSIKQPLLILGGIIVAFTIIKVPHFANDFSGSHSLKYAAVLEPAVNMLHSTPFSFISRYRGEAFSDPQFFGRLEYFESFPLLIWLNYLGLQLFSIDQLPTISRVIMHFIGVITLILMFQVLKKISKSVSYALAATLVFSLQIMFLFTSFVTVNELILLSGMLFAVLLVLKNNPQFDSISGSVLSLAYLVKASIVLWGFIPVLAMLAISSSNKKKFLKRMILFSIGATVTYVSFFLFIRPLPSYTVVMATISFIMFFVLLFLTFSSKVANYIYEIKFSKLPKVSCLALVILLLISTLFLNKQITAYLPEFTSIDIASTISSLLPTVFNKYFWFYLPGLSAIFVTFSLGMFVMWLFKYKRHPLTLFITSILISLTLYAVFASKVLYFHNYYFLPFFFLLSLLLPTVLLLTKRLFIPFVIFSIAFFSPMVASKGQELLSEKRTGFFEAIEYLQQHTTSSHFILDDSAAAALGIFLDAAFTNSNTTYFRDAMQQHSLATAAQIHNLKYIITFNNTPNLDRIVQASDSSFEVLSRDDFLLTTTAPETTDEDLDKLDAIQQQLHLVKNFGAYKIYSFKELENDD